MQQSRKFLIFAIAAISLLFHSQTFAAELTFTSQEFAPFSYTLNGVVSGPIVDVIKAVCGEMNVTPTFVIYPWVRAQQEAKDGTANGLFVIAKTADRDKWVYYSHQILESEYGFFVEATNSLKYKQPSDVKGYTVGVYGPSATSAALDKIKANLGGDLSIDLRVDDESGFTKLSLGRVKAVFSNRDVGYALIKKLGLKNIRYAGRYEVIKYYIGFSQKNTDKSLVDQFNSTYLTLYQKGTIQNILKKYDLESIQPE